MTLEYKTEATEVAAALVAEEEQGNAAVGVLPQPFVTVACAQNENLQMVLDLTKEWEKVQQDGSSLVTGVTGATKAFMEEHPEAVGCISHRPQEFCYLCKRKSGPGSTMGSRERDYRQRAHCPESHSQL